MSALLAVGLIGGSMAVVAFSYGWTGFIAVATLIGLCILATKRWW